MNRSDSFSTADRWRRIESLFSPLIELPREERHAALQRLEDPDLRTEVAKLLDAHERLTTSNGAFLESLDSTLASEILQRSFLPNEALTVGRYRIVRRLGRGGMGVVYQAHDPRLDRSVALKLLPPHLSGDPAAVRRLTAEARAASALDHPNIETVYEIGETVDGRIFIAMAYYEGETVRERIARRPMTVDEAVDLGAQIAEGLSAAHRGGIIHRDIKPENLLVTRDGVLKIVDFGIAKLVGEALTSGSETPGTAAYMSPEQTLEEGVDHRTDLWSVGVVLYEMLAGSRPFGGDRDSLISAIRSEPPPPLLSIRGDLPPVLVAVVERCLEKDRERRFDSAGTLVQELRAVVGIVPSRPTARRAGRPSPARWRLAPIIAGAGLAGVVLVTALMRSGTVVSPWASATTAASAANVRSLVVLPLDDVSPDPSGEFFTNGMTEALIDGLSKIESLKVISRTSSIQYRDVDKPLPQIARELDVDAVLEGSVVRTGDRVRISIRLVHAPSERALWSESYERNLSDILALQDEIARTVAQEVQAQITPTAARRLTGARRVDPQAYDAYLRGRYWWKTRTRDGLEKSLVYFRHAIEIDPTWARGYAGLADAYYILGIGGHLPPAEVYPKARAAALQAIELEESLAEPHATLSLVMLVDDWDWEGSEREIERALELDPNYATGWQYYAWTLVCLGRVEEALRAIRKAQELDPLSPRINSNVGAFLIYARDYESAERELRKSMGADSMESLLRLAEVYVQQGRFEEAVLTFERLDRTAAFRGSLFRAYLAHAYAVGGNRPGARRILHELEQLGRTEFVDPMPMAIAYSGLGDLDQAFSWLERGYRERALLADQLQADPRLDPLRSEPRFVDLMRRMGLGA